MSEQRVLIVGAGIAGLAASLACGRAGLPVQLVERAPEFQEVGAGIQIGPNVTRILRDWGLGDALAQVASLPDMLQVRSAVTGRALGSLPLGLDMRQRYGAPYATLHRADLHQLLLQAVQAQGRAEMQLATQVLRFEQSTDGVDLVLANGGVQSGSVLLGADGLWSAVRQQLLDDAAPALTGHLAYRALLRQAELPQHLRSHQVTVWLGPRLHAVQYPVRGGDWLNLVVIVQGEPDWMQAANSTPGEMANWNQEADRDQLQRALRGSCGHLSELVAAAPAWRLWILCDREPMQEAQEHARGRVALIGDAAHPMRPYLAQGAGMAIEDAAAVAQVLSQAHPTTEAALQDFAQRRWARNRQVQERSRRNGKIFHATGLVRWGRDAAMAVLGTRVLDLPWLYGATQPA
ncbi:MAG: FAD-dependent monooxygenase [Burkholderiaceae bacterium]